MQCFELKSAGLSVKSGGLYTNRIQIGILDMVTRSSWFIILNLTFAAEVAVFYCGQRQQHLRGYREPIYGRRLPQFVVAVGHNNIKNHLTGKIWSP